MNLFDLDDRVTAAAIAAAGTIIGTLIQLKFAWRKEVRERARGVPATKKSRRGPVLAVGLLLVGALVGGFVLSQYLVRQSDLDSAARHSQLQTQLAQIGATAARNSEQSWFERACGRRSRWGPKHHRDDISQTVPRARRRRHRCSSGLRRAGSTAGHAMRERALVGRGDNHGSVRSA